MHIPLPDVFNFLYYCALLHWKRPKAESQNCHQCAPPVPWCRWGWNEATSNIGGGHVPLCLRTLQTAGGTLWVGICQAYSLCIHFPQTSTHFTWFMPPMAQHSVLSCTPLRTDGHLIRMGFGGYFFACKVWCISQSCPKPWNWSEHV